MKTLDNFTSVLPKFDFNAKDPQFSISRRSIMVGLKFPDNTFVEFYSNDKFRHYSIYKLTEFNFSLVKD